MIFLTVGTQLPFDRLTRAMDRWCAERGPDIPVFGQIGILGPDNYRPRNYEFSERITPQDFCERTRAAQLIVSHAGMGTIITALGLSKPIVVMARRARFGEQRNDHQIATVKHLGDRRGLTVAGSEADLPDLLDRVLARESADTISTKLPAYADARLIDSLRSFIHGEDVRDRPKASATLEPNAGTLPGKGVDP